MGKVIVSSMKEIGLDARGQYYIGNVRGKFDRYQSQDIVQQFDGRLPTLFEAISTGKLSDIEPCEYVWLDHIVACEGTDLSGDERWIGKYKIDGIPEEFIEDGKVARTLLLNGNALRRESSRYVWTPTEVFGLDLKPNSTSVIDDIFDQRTGFVRISYGKRAKKFVITLGQGLCAVSVGICEDAKYTHIHCLKDFANNDQMNTFLVKEGLDTVEPQEKNLVIRNNFQKNWLDDEDVWDDPNFLEYIHLYSQFHDRELVQNVRRAVALSGYGEGGLYVFLSAGDKEGCRMAGNMLLSPSMFFSDEDLMTGTRYRYHLAYLAFANAEDRKGILAAANRIKEVNPELAFEGFSIAGDEEGMELCREMISKRGRSGYNDRKLQRTLKAISKDVLIAAYNYPMAKYDINDPRWSRWYRSQKRRELRFEKLVEGIELDGRSILDVGCGSANLYYFLWRRGVDVKYTGVDANPKVVSAAKKLNPDMDLRVLDITEEDAVDKLGVESFDFVAASGIFCLKTLTHRADREDVLRRMVEVSKLGVVANFLDIEKVKAAGKRLKPLIYYHSPEDVRKILKSEKNVKRVSIIRDYPIPDFTAVALK